METIGIASSFYRTVALGRVIRRLRNSNASAGNRTLRREQ